VQKTKKKPTISIITIVYNGFDVIRDTLESIVNNSHNEVEYIVIDGNSTDGTKQLIQEYSDHIDLFISEPDTGIYNAMNKGITISQGKYIHILNAGDSYVNNDSIDRILSIIKDKEPEFISSTVKYILPNNTVKFLSMNGGVDTICHPGLVVKSQNYKENLFDESFQFASDIEFFLRVINKSDVFITNDHYVNMPSGGLGSSIDCLKESIAIYLKYYKFDRVIFCLLKFIKIKIRLKFFRELN
jgi:glycosyltransferase involved in cell wall biosynthesis